MGGHESLSVREPDLQKPREEEKGGCEKESQGDPRVPEQPSERKFGAHRERSGSHGGGKPFGVGGGRQLHRPYLNGREGKMKVALLSSGAL